MNYDYNMISKIYDNVREADFDVVKFMIEKAHINERSCVLEIGCGTGNYLTIMHKMAKAQVWGIDSSLGMLSKAKEKCNNAILIEGDAVKLSEIPSSTFDLVYMVDVIHHIKNIDEMFHNIRRVLKQNAIVMVFSDNHEHIRNRLTTKYFPETLEVELKRYQDTDDIIRSLEKNMFKEIDNGVIEIGKDMNYGPKLIEIASKKGYSMFGLISEEAIMKGIERIKEDMVEKPVIYNQRAPYIMALKDGE